MPDRVLRQGILTSDVVNGLSHGAELFYRRLLSVVDDFGRFDGRVSVIRAALYPLQLDKVSTDDVSEWLKEVVASQLVMLYYVDDKQYIIYGKWKQRLRAKKSKWPDPLVNDGQMSDTCQSMASEGEGEGESRSTRGEGGNAHADASNGTIPTVGEVIGFGMGAPGIPAGYCKYYHAKKDETHGWVKNGHLIKWQGEIVRWWTSDRESWMGKHGGKKKGPNI